MFAALAQLSDWTPLDISGPNVYIRRIQWKVTMVRYTTGINPQLIHLFFYFGLVYLFIFFRCGCVHAGCWPLNQFGISHLSNCRNGGFQYRTGADIHTGEKQERENVKIERTWWSCCIRSFTSSVYKFVLVFITQEKIERSYFKSEIKRKMFILIKFNYLPFLLI